MDGLSLNITLHCIKFKGDPGYENVKQRPLPRCVGGGPHQIGFTELHSHQAPGHSSALMTSKLASPNWPGLRVDQNGNMSLGQLMATWARREGMQEQDVLSVVQENMFQGVQDQHKTRL